MRAHSGASAKDVVGFEGLYLATACGEIISQRSSRALRPCSAGKGYRVVTLCQDRREFKRYVHRLVAEAFHGPSMGRTVNHKDGVKTNNSAQNLEWMTIRENNHHAILNGLRATSPETIAMVSRQSFAPQSPANQEQGQSE